MSFIPAAGIEEYQDIIENANDLIQSVDENGRFLYVNKKWRDVLGYTDEETRRMAFPDIVHQNHLQACFALFAELKKGKSLDNVRTQFVAKNGRVIDVDGNISVRMKDSNFLSTWGIFRDVTERRKVENKLQEEQQFSQALIDSLPSIFYVFDGVTSRMLRWNKNMEYIFGYSNEETAKMSPLDFFDEKDRETTKEAIRQVLTKRKITVEARIRTKDGRTIPHFFSAVHSRIAGKDYIVGLGIDITDFRKQEEELARANAVLKIRDEQIAKEHELNRAKSEFVSLASHQLKTPLTIIKWYADMLNAGYADNVLKKQQEYIGKIYSNTERMIELVDSLLNVSRLELGVFAVKKESVDLKNKIEAILFNFEPKIKEKNLKLLQSYSNDNFIISADLKMIQIIFENMIFNAIKYTPDGGTINVKMRKKENEILIEIADTGIGIPENQQSKIFTKFFRADNASSYKADGTGLGLYIVKTIVEKMDGKIWFESAENKGATFYVAIPIES